MRPNEVDDAILYMENIWGDYGKHKKHTEALKKYIEHLEKQSQSLITEKEMDEFIKGEHPSLLLSSVNEDEYKDVIEEVLQNDTLVK